MRRSSKIEIPDPAVGSGGVSTRQPTFEGSDRQGRGRLVRAACLGPLPEDELCHIAGWPNEHERALRIADMLVVEGIMRRDANGCYQLA